MGPFILLRAHWCAWLRYGLATGFQMERRGCSAVPRRCLRRRVGEPFAICHLPFAGRWRQQRDQPACRWQSTPTAGLLPTTSRLFNADPRTEPGPRNCDHRFCGSPAALGTRCMRGHLVAANPRWRLTLRSSLAASPLTKTASADSHVLQFLNKFCTVASQHKGSFVSSVEGVTMRLGRLPLFGPCSVDVIVSSKNARQRSWFSSSCSSTGSSPFTGQLHMPKQRLWSPGCGRHTGR